MIKKTILTILPILFTVFILLSACSLSPQVVSAEPYWYNCTALTGGTDYALDNISGVRLNDGDVAVVLTSAGHTYFYLLDADSAVAESSPYYIAPDNVAGDKRWVLQTISWNSQFHSFTDTDVTPSVSAGVRFLTVGTTAISDFDDGITGQIIHIVAESSITITNGLDINLDGGVDFDMIATDTLTLICKADNRWYEIGRGDNG